jgi:ubiquinol-cytochrome c reductase cytochrome c1 subunit
MKKTLIGLMVAATVAFGAAAYAQEGAAPAAATPAESGVAAVPTAAAQTDAAKPPAEAAAASSAEEETPLAHQHWPQDGIFGKYDMAAVQRGFQVYKEVCSNCHSLRLLAYRDLKDLGYTDAQVKAVASQYTVKDGPNDEGEMFDRPARPSDRFHSPFPNEKAARAANGGALPPDMSLLANARKGGPDYIYGILTGYGTPPAGVTMTPGLYWNHAFPGHQIAMPQPLSDGQVTYSDGTAASLQQAAHDVSQFLVWASNPHMEQRKAMGIKVILFMLVFAGIMRAAKRKVWAGAH